MKLPNGKILHRRKSIIGDFDTVFNAVFGPVQHDAHLTEWRFFQKFYGGDHARYLDARATSKRDRAAARARLMQTTDGRAFLASIDTETTESSHD